MPQLKTTYLGIPISSPIIVGASSLSNMVERIQKIEAAGAGALVIRSLFEEQIRADQMAYEKGLRQLDLAHLEEAKMYFPSLDSDAAKSYFMWIKKSRDAVKMPLIASLNASANGNWVYYAQELEKTGVNAIELNVYSVEANPDRTSSQIEQELFDMVSSVRSVVRIPLAVKLSPYYTSISHVARQLDLIGVNGLTLFNRFLQPDIDPEELTLRSELHFSHADEIKLPLRWTAILYGRVRADIAMTTGVHSGRDAAKAILAGAQVVQVASILYQNGLEHLSRMNDDLRRWAERHQFNNVGEVRGRLSQQNVNDPHTFERAQYVRLLMSES
jgi:dihydroorotate dehydrogenase (fumarate)